MKEPIFLPDPLGLLEKLTGGAVKDPIRHSVEKDHQISLKKSQSSTEYPISQLELIDHQKRELAKSLTLLEAHLRQGGIIAGKPCDCINKHSMEVEALADETSSITGELFYTDLANWAKGQSHKGTPEAVSSGKYKVEYLDLAGEARAWRKKIMGTEAPVLRFQK